MRLKSSTLDGSRRSFLMFGAAAALAACGGGGGGDAGGGDGGGGGGAGDRGPSGWLVYRNSSAMGVIDLATGAASSFEPGSKPSVDPGAAAIPGRLAVAALDGDNRGFSIATFDLQAGRKTSYPFRRELSFQTSAPAFDATAARMALSVNELASPSGLERVDRVLVVDWGAKAVVSVLDGWNEPVWARATGELIVRDPESRRLRVFGPSLDDRGWLGDFAVIASVGAYDVSPDGRYVVYDDITRLNGFDRQTGATWPVADRISSLRAPTFSPDGRHLAVHAIDLVSGTLAFTTYVPHAFPFEPGVTQTVDSARHRLQVPLANTSGRMGWVA